MIPVSQGGQRRRVQDEMCGAETRVYGAEDERGDDGDDELWSDDGEVVNAQNSPRSAGCVLWSGRMRRVGRRAPSATITAMRCYMERFDILTARRRSAW